MQKVSVLGSGPVGEVLANGFLKYGHEVMRGSREPNKLGDWQKAAGARAKVGSFQEASSFGDIVVLAVKGGAAESIVGDCAGALSGKIVMDTTNPIADKPPEHGVLSFFTSLDESLMERLQRRAPGAKFVKAYSSVGNTLMVNPDFGGTRPTMFICGNDADAKKTVRNVLDRFGWDAEDLGTVEAARAIEPLCMLWCIPGFLNNSWNHAFKLLRPAS